MALFTKVTKKQCAEFGQVAVLALLFLALYRGGNNFVIAAFVLILVTILLPIVFFPFAVIWFGLARILSAVSSRVMLSLLFFLLVLPTGLLRRLSGKDNLRRRQFKKSGESVMTERDHIYQAADLLRTF